MSYFNADQVAAAGGPDHTPRGEAEIRREEAARIREHLNAEIAAWVATSDMEDLARARSERALGARSAIAAVLAALDRICPPAPGEPEAAASVHEIPGVGPVTVPEGKPDRMSRKELRLAASLLQAYSADLGNRSCNDWEFPADWSLEERQAFCLAYETWNGTPEDYDPKRPRLSDFCVAAFLGEKLGRLA